MLHADLRRTDLECQEPPEQGAPAQPCWRVGTRTHYESFTSFALGYGLRSELMSTVRSGEQLECGPPVSELREKTSPTW